MKRICSTLFLLCLTFIAFGQHITYEDLRMGKSAKELTGSLNGANIDSYTASDGITYTSGSEIVFGMPYNGGKFYNNMFDRTTDVLNTLSDTPPADTRIASRYGGKATIKKIICVPTDGFNRRTSGCKIYVVLNRGGLAITNFESALDQGEIQSNGYSSERALQELKKAKEKLDLELITREEYDAIKAELSKYIK